MPIQGVADLLSPSLVFKLADDALFLLSPTAFEFFEIVQVDSVRHLRSSSQRCDRLTSHPD
jgi:hypothetical protein